MNIWICYTVFVYHNLLEINSLLAENTYGMYLIAIVWGIMFN